MKTYFLTETELRAELPKLDDEITTDAAIDVAIQKARENEGRLAARLSQCKMLTLCETPSSNPLTQKSNA
jgi:hypothetical protein